MARKHDLAGLSVTPAQGRQIRRLWAVEAVSRETAAFEDALMPPAWGSGHRDRVCDPQVLSSLFSLALTTSRVLHDVENTPTIHWLTGRGQALARAMLETLADD